MVQLSQSHRAASHRAMLQVQVCLVQRPRFLITTTAECSLSLRSGVLTVAGVTSFYLEYKDGHSIIEVTVLHFLFLPSLRSLTSCSPLPSDLPQK